MRCGGAKGGSRDGASQSTGTITGPKLLEGENYVKCVDEATQWEDVGMSSRDERRKFLTRLRRLSS